MTTVIHIQSVSSRSKIDTLREFGHRVFVELGDDGKPVGYFVERRLDVAQAQTPKTRARSAQPLVTGDQYVVWTGKRGDYRQLSLIERVYLQAIELAAKPAKRSQLEDAIVEATSYTKHQVTGAVSRLLNGKVLRTAANA